MAGLPTRAGSQLPVEQGEKSGGRRRGQDEKIGARLSLAAEGGRQLAHRFPALIAAPAAAQERIWLTGARLFDGTGSRLRENAAILIEDGIESSAGSLTPPSRALTAPGHWTWVNVS